MVPALILVLLAQAASEPVAPANPVGPPPAVAAPPSTETPGRARRLDDPSAPRGGAVPQGAYEANVRGAFARSQTLQGPLDGSWVLKDASGDIVYRVHLVDPGFAGAALEGAWSDPRGPGPDGSGFFTGVARDGAVLVLSFARAGSGPVVARLTPRSEGGFAGEMRAGDPARDTGPLSVLLVRP